MDSVDDYDVYHTYDYHQIAKESSDSAVLIKYEQDGVLIGLPLLIRKISGSAYFDATSVYGYSGPISNRIPLNFNPIDFQKRLRRFFIENNIISVFVRLHPFLPFQNIILYGFGDLSYLGRVVNINLTLSLEKQRRHYQRRLKTYVNKAKRLLKLKYAQTDEDHQIFKSLYYQNMDRLNAKSIYYFDDEYFKNLRSAKDFKTEILLAAEEASGEVIAGAMFIKTKSTVQYHLSGSSNEHLHLNGTKFLIDQMRIKAHQEGYFNFNLGGGLGADENNSLFKFKSSFSDEFHPFFVWKLITRKGAYKNICKRNNITNTDSDFFPLYRLKEHV
ncbi:peptidoglycan bridge formation glycyltransferase FemA/FemB family protein [Hyunsoonleella sp. SJ7]|uniref:Peptidoglycan bridge formation glycyltransferase FemA/FemB family protein n=1 Tax=Hyunsoonleella aquatilis TaxID=2762758 RepID=A0A923KIQ6_9FLAO|nr:peptidoglycan bridge formation glycyltransferase FemA/FemB family protein [Hyunsoonleella aquatilis]MBC3758994.1 peptidoglycan bridge formation glycyltransferase FemA/FemB family protein [Hyunsoonleella aquatilis]